MRAISRSVSRSGCSEPRQQRPAGQRDVAPLGAPGGPRGRCRSRRSRRAAMALSSCFADGVGERADLRPVLGRERADAAQQVAQLALAAEVRRCRPRRARRASARRRRPRARGRAGRRAGRGRTPGPRRRRGRRYWALATSAMLANVAASRTAMSARILRSSVDAGVLEPADELAVGEAVLARGGVQPDDPQGAQLALALLAADVGVGHRVEQRLARRLDQLASACRAGPRPP